jgi:spermidine/putrescine transport system substrate-binding protein
VTRSLTLLSWPDYVSPETLAQFEGEFDASLRVEIVPGAAELLARMRAAAAPPDVLVPPDYAVRELEAEGRLAALDHSLLTNLKYLEPRFRTGRAHDADCRVSLIKDWGTTGFMYRSDLIQADPRSWADFWRLAQAHSGRVSVLDSAAEVIGAALKMRGRSYNSGTEAGLDQARRDLMQLKPHVHAFETDYKPLLASGEVSLALGWNGDALALRARGVPITYVIPSEGSQVWEDDWAIAAGSARTALAHAFLNFVLRPEVSAQEARFTRYATGNRAAWERLDSAERSDPATYPSVELLGRLEAGLPLDPAARAARARLWQELRA